MVQEITLREHEGALGITLPKAMTDRLNLVAGDKVFAIETEFGILLTPYDAGMLRVLQVEARISEKYKAALQVLAQS